MPSGGFISDGTRTKPAPCQPAALITFSFSFSGTVACPLAHVHVHVQRGWRMKSPTYASGVLTFLRAFSSSSSSSSLPAVSPSVLPSRYLPHSVLPCPVNYLRPSALFSPLCTFLFHVFPPSSCPGFGSRGAVRCGTARRGVT